MFGTQFFASLNFFDRNLFTKILFDPNVFGTLNNLWTKNLVNPKFWTQYFVWTPIFLEQTFGKKNSIKKLRLAKNWVPNVWSKLGQ